MTTLASTLLVVFAAIGAVSLGTWFTFLIQYINRRGANTPAEIELVFIKKTQSDLSNRNTSLEAELKTARQDLDKINNTIIAKLLAK